MGKYFDAELVSTIVGTIAGAVVGYISFLINQPLVNVIIAVVVFAVFALVGKKRGLGDQKHSALAYFLAWIVVWTIFYNTRIV